MKAYPTPPFTVEMAFLPNVFAYASTGIACGLCIRDSVGLKLVCYGLSGGSSDMNINGNNYTSPTASSGTCTGWPSAKHFSESPLVWIKYYDDGTINRVISISVDGITWSQMVSISRTDWITPNQIGICVNGGDGYSVSSGQSDTGMTVLHWRQY